MRKNLRLLILFLFSLFFLNTLKAQTNLAADDKRQWLADNSFSKQQETLTKYLEADELLYRLNSKQAAI